MLKKMITPVMLAALPFIFCCCDRAENGKDNSDVITGTVFDSTKANAQLLSLKPTAQWSYLNEVFRRPHSNQKTAETWLLDKVSQLAASNQDSTAIPKVKALADAAKNDLFRSQILLRLGYIYTDLGDHEKAAGYFRTSLASAQQAAHGDMQVLALIGIATTHYYRLQHDSAVVYLEKGIKVAETHDLDFRKPDLYGNIASNKNLGGQNLEAVRMFVEAANLYKEKGDLDNLAIVYNNIGVVFLDMKRNQKAVEYFNLAREINEKNKNIAQLIMNYGNLGLAYKNQDSISQAKFHYLKGRDLSEESGEEFELSRTYYNLGNLAMIEEKYDQADRYFDSSEHYCRKNNIAYGLMLLEMNRSNLYSKTGNPQQAIATGLKALKDLEAYNIPYETATVCKVLYSAYKAIGKLDKALYYYEKYVSITEELSNSESLKIIWDFENQYEKEKNARQISELEKDVIRQQAHKKMMLLLLGGVLLLLIAAVFLFVQSRRHAAIQAQLDQARYENLNESMMAKSRELTGKALLIAQINEQTALIRTQIIQLMPHCSLSVREMLQDLIHTIERNQTTKTWEEFEENLAQINSELYKKLLAIDPGLTPTELKICALIAQNQSSKDIAILTNRGAQTVANIRHNLRKKLNLGPDDNLATFIRSLQGY
jgi:tetratricopeptide (TPR) repeat protein